MYVKGMNSEKLNSLINHVIELRRGDSEIFKALNSRKAFYGPHTSSGVTTAKETIEDDFLGKEKLSCPSLSCTRPGWTNYLKFPGGSKKTGIDWAAELTGETVAGIAESAKEWAKGVQLVKPSISGHVYWIADSQGMANPAFLAKRKWKYGVHGFWSPKNQEVDSKGAAEEYRDFASLLKESLLIFFP